MMSIHYDILIDRIRELTLEPDSWQEAIATIRLSLYRPSRYQNSQELNETAKNEILDLLDQLKQPFNYVDETGRNELIYAYDSHRVYPQLQRLEQDMLKIDHVYQQYQAHISTTLIDALQRLSMIYRNYLDVIMNGDEVARAQSLAYKVSLAGPGLGYYYVTPEMARALLCLSVYGEDSRLNAEGNHAVAALHGAHYKSGKGHSPIQPGTEQAVTVWMQLFSPNNQQIAAASTAIKISGVPYQSVVVPINDSGEQAEALAELQIRQRDGSKMDAIFAREPTLAARLEMQTSYKSSLIQVGYSISGVSLADVIMLQAYTKRCQQRLGDEMTIKLITDTIERSDHFLHFAAYYVPALALTEPVGDKATDIACLYQCYQAFFDDFLPHIQLTRLRQGEFNTLYDKFGRDYLIKLLGFLSKYPWLCDGLDLTEAVVILRLFSATLPKLFKEDETPVDVATALEQIPHLLDTLDKGMTSALWLGLMLSLPNDAKFDNFIFNVIQRHQGRIIRSAIVAIDCDESLVWPMTLKVINKKPEADVIVNIKNALFFVDSIANQPLDEQVRSHLLGKDATDWMMLWLSQLWQQDQLMRAWFINVIFKPDDVVAEKDSMPILLPWFVAPALLTSIYHLLQQLQDCLRANPVCTHAELFAVLFPEIAALYQYIREQHVHLTGTPIEPMIAQHAIYHSACFTLNGRESDVGATTTWQDFLNVNPRWQTVMTDKPGCRTWPQAQKALPRELKLLADYTDVTAAARELLQQMNWDTFYQPTSPSLPLLNTLMMQSTKIQLPLKADANITALLHHAISQGLVGIVDWLVPKSVEHIRLLSEALHEVCTHWHHFPDKAKSMLDILLAPIKPSLFPRLGALSGITSVQQRPSDRRRFADPNIYNELGETPLMTLLRYAKDEDIEQVKPLMMCLIKAGAVMDIPRRHRLDSLLDLVIERDQPYLCLALLEQGAYRVDPEKALALAERYALVERFRTVHLGIAWAWLKTKLGVSASPEIRSLGYESNARHHVQRQLLQYQERGFPFHIKFYPELSGVEFAVQRLNYRMFGRGIVPSDLKTPIVLTEVVPQLYMPTVEGVTLETIFSQTADANQIKDRFDPRLLSALICFSMLINLEDGKPDSYVAKKILIDISNYDELIAIDQDHAFMPEFFENKMMIKCILFCLDNMYDSVHPDVCQQLLACDPDVILAQWLDDIEQYHQQLQSGISDDMLDNLLRRAGFSSKIRNLFKEESVESTKRLPSMLPMIFFKHVLPDVYQKFHRLKKTLQDNPRISHIGLLQALMPRVGQIYYRILQAKPSPSSRYQAIEEICRYEYSHELLQAVCTSTYKADKKALPSEQGRTLIEKLLAKEGKHSRAALTQVATFQYGTVTEAKAWLDQVTRIKAGWQDIYQATLAGDLSRLNALDASWNIEKSRMFNEIDFSATSSATQQKLIDYAISSYLSFSSLTLINANLFTKVQLRKLIDNSQRLSNIYMIGCIAIDNQAIRYLFENLEQDLISIHLSHMNMSAVCGSYQMLSLESLILEDCALVDSIDLYALKLRRLEIIQPQSSSVLITLNLQSSVLFKLTLSGVIIPLTLLTRIITAQNNLVDMDLSNLSIYTVDDKLKHRTDKLNNLQMIELPLSLQVLRLDGTAISFNSLMSYLLQQPALEVLSLAGCTQLTPASRHFFETVVATKNLRLLVEAQTNGVLVALETMLQRTTPLTHFEFTHAHQPRTLWWLALHSLGITHLHCRFVLNDEDRIALDNYILVHGLLTQLTLAYDMNATRYTNHVTYFYELHQQPGHQCDIAVYAGVNTTQVSRQRVWLTTLTQKQQRLPLISGFLLYPTWYTPDHPSWTDASARAWIAGLCEYRSFALKDTLAWHGLSIIENDAGIMIDWPDLPDCTREVQAQMAYQLSQQLKYLIPNLMVDKSSTFPLRLVHGKGQPDADFVIEMKALLTLLIPDMTSLRHINLSTRYGLLKLADTQSLVLNLLSKHIQLNEILAISGSDDRPHALPQLLTMRVVSIAVLPDERVMMSLSDGAFQLWDAQKDTVQKLPEPRHGMYARTMTVLSNHEVLCCYQDGSACVWDFSQDQYQALDGHFNQSIVIAHPKGLLVGTSQGVLTLWTNRQRQSQSLYTYNQPILAMTLLADQNRVAVGFADGTWSTYDIETKKPIGKVYEGHTAGIFSMALLPDGKLITASRDQSLRIWHMITDECIGIIDSRLYQIKALAVLQGQLIHLSSQGTLWQWPAFHYLSLSLTQRQQWQRAVQYAVYDDRVMLTFSLKATPDLRESWVSCLSQLFPDMMQTALWDDERNTLTLPYSPILNRALQVLLSAVVLPQRATHRLSHYYHEPLWVVTQPIAVPVIETEPAECIAPSISSSHEPFDIPESVLIESRAIAQRQAKVGPRTIPGWQLNDVPDDGNCFYHAIAHQAELLALPCLKRIPDGTARHDWLRAQVEHQGIAFKDRDWAGHDEARALITALHAQGESVVIVTVETLQPERGYTAHYIGVDNTVTTQAPTDLMLQVPTGRPIIRLAATGNHYLSVLSHPELTQGALGAAYSSTVSLAESLAGVPGSLFAGTTPNAMPSMNLSLRA